jgi:hypothetical protein
MLHEGAPGCDVPRYSEHLPDPLHVRSNISHPIACTRIHSDTKKRIQIPFPVSIMLLLGIFMLSCNLSTCEFYVNSSSTLPLAITNTETQS